MAAKNRQKIRDFDSDPYDDFEEDLDGDLDDISAITRDFDSADWEDPSGMDTRFSTRRKIERRNDLKELYSQFDDWDDIDLGNDW